MADAEPQTLPDAEELLKMLELDQHFEATGRRFVLGRGFGA